MKNSKLKLSFSLIFVALIVFCFICFISAYSHETNQENLSNNTASSTPVLTKSSSLPQSADEIYHSIPSKETINNLPAYINKTIEYMNLESTNNNQSNGEDKKVSNSSLSFFSLTDELDEIYALVQPKDDNTYELILTADKPSNVAYFTIGKNDRNVPGYCAEYSSKISSVKIMPNIENFHPVSTKQWFGSYLIEDTKKSLSPLSSIDGLRYLNMDRVEDASFMFSGTYKLNNFNDEDYSALANLSLNNLKYGIGMFAQSNLDNRSLDAYFNALSKASKFENSQYMFFGCNNLKNLTGSVNLPNMQDATGMFVRSGLQNFNNNIEFGNSVYSVSMMFFECQSLISCNASSMLKNGTSYYYTSDQRDETNRYSESYSMFEKCNSLEVADFGEWNFSLEDNATHINYTFEMFRECWSLKTIYARYDANWAKTIRDSSHMFYECNNLVGQNRTTFTTTHMEKARIDEGKINPGYFTASNNCAPPEIKMYSLEDPIDNGIVYLPICNEQNKLPSDIVFYDSDCKKIEPGDNRDYYLMKDLLNARCFSGHSKITTIRAVHDVFFLEVYNRDGSFNIGFNEKLKPNEHVFSFPGYNSPVPTVNGVALSDIWNAYTYRLGTDMYWSTSYHADFLFPSASAFVCSNSSFEGFIAEGGFAVTSDVAILKDLDPQKMHPMFNTERITFDYDDRVIEKITNGDGKITYPKNKQFFLTEDLTDFKVVAKDNTIVPRAFDGINELKNNNNEFRTDSHLGLHDIYVDRQNRFDVDFLKDINVSQITDINGSEIEGTPNVSENGTFMFKVKYDDNQEYVVGEVKADGNILLPDKNNCYVIENIKNHVKVEVASQKANSLTLVQDNSTYYYRPIFNRMSSSQISFYDNEGKYIWPTANNGHDYVMSDLKDVRSFIGNGYKFQAIRFNLDVWSNFVDIKCDKATKYNGDMIDGDCCASLSFDKGNDRPTVGGIFIGDIINSYENFSNIRKFWGPDIYTEDTSFSYNLSDTKDKGNWTTIYTRELLNVVIQHEFSDCYNIKFEGGSGVQQIVQIDETGKEIDVTNGTTFKKNEEFKFRIKCVDDKGIDDIFYNEVSISGHDYEHNGLLLDNNSRNYKILGNDFKHNDTSCCVVKVTTSNVSSLKIGNDLYHPVFDTQSFEHYRYFDDYGQCFTPTFGSHEEYRMSDITYATKYKLSSSELNITCARTINEPIWENVFTYNDSHITTGFTSDFQQKVNKNGDRVHIIDDVSTFPSINFIKLSSIYDAYNCVGFGSAEPYFWTNKMDYYESKLCAECFNKLGDSPTYSHYIINEYKEHASMILLHDFRSDSDPSCTVEFHKDDGVKKITDKDGNEITNSVSVDKGSNFQFKVTYKDGHVENRVNDGLSSLVRDKESNTYTVSNIQSQRVINIESQISHSLKSPSTSNHPDVICKPLFDKLSANDIKFYDVNGYCIKPSNDDKYIMSDLKNVKEFISLSGNFEFKVFGVVDSSWNEAFGEYTTGKADSYVGLKLDDIDDCATLNFNYNEIPKICGFELDYLYDSYDLPKFFLGNTSDQDTTYLYSFDSNYANIKGKWESQFSRDDTRTLVFTKTIKDSYTVNFQIDDGIEKIIDDSGQDITNIKKISYGSNLRFKVISKSGFCVKELEANGERLNIDTDGFYTINNICNDISISCTSQIFGSDKQVINFDKGYGVECITDVDKKPIEDSIENIRGNTFTFKVKSKDAHVVDKVLLNGEVLKPNADNEYIINSNLLEISVSVISKEAQSLCYNGQWYQPLFDHASKNNVKFYDDYGFLHPNKDGYYTMQSIRGVKNYVIEGDYKFKAVRVVKDSWVNSFGDIEEGSATKYMHSMLPNDKCTSLLFHNDGNDLSIVDLDGNNVLLKNVYDAYYYDRDGFSGFWTSDSINKDSACEYIYVVDDNWDFYNTDKTKSTNAVVIENEFGKDSVNVKIEQDANIDKVTDVYGTKLNSTFRLNSTFDFQFEIVAKENYGVFNVYNNNVLLLPDVNGRYTIPYPEQDVNITITSATFQSLHCGEKIYHPVSDTIPSNKVKFYDYSNKIIVPTGNDGYNYTMDDLKDAASFVCIDYTFNAVALDKHTWNEAFTNVADGKATKYNIPLDVNESCTAFDFNKGKKPIIDGLTIDKIVSAYYAKECMTFWSPYTDNDKTAYLYSVNDEEGKEWKQNVSREESHGLLIRKVFATGNKVNVRFERDYGVKDILNNKDQQIFDNIDVIQGQELLFKCTLYDSFYMHDVTFNNKKIEPNQDGFYHIMIDPSIAKDNLIVKIATTTIHSLKIIDTPYKPIIDENDHTFTPDVIKFYKEDYTYISPGEKNYYQMTDLKDAALFLDLKNKNFNAVALIPHTWEEAFGGAIYEKATEYVPRDIDNKTICDTLSFDTGQQPKVAGYNLQKLMSVYYDSCNQFWGNTPTEYDKASYCNITYPDTYEWKDDFKNITKFIVVHRQFDSSNKFAVKFSKDDSVSGIFDSKHEALPTDFEVPYGYDLRFKVECREGFAINSVKVNGASTTMDEDCYFKISNIKNNIFIDIETFRPHQVSVNLNKDSSQYIDKFVDDKGNELPVRLTLDMNSSFRFKVVPVEGHTIRQVQIGTKVLRPDKDGFYYVLNLDKDANITAKATSLTIFRH